MTEKIVIGFRKCGTSSLCKYLDAVHDEEIILDFEKLKEKYPKNTELHIILRNPMDRAYSDYQRLKSYYQKKDLGIHSFEEAIKKDAENILFPGIFMNYLPQVIKYYPKVILWNLEDLQQNKEFPQENKQEYSEMHPMTRKKLQEFYAIHQKLLIDYLAENTPGNPPKKKFFSKVKDLLQ